MRAETMAALETSHTALTAKAPDEVAAYRDLVLGAAQVVADAKGGVTPVETAMLEEVRKALDGA